MLGALSSRSRGAFGSRLTPGIFNSLGGQSMNSEGMGKFSESRRNYNQYYNPNIGNKLMKLKHKEAQKAKFARRHIWPRDNSGLAPKKGGNQTWTYKVDDVKMSIRSINWYVRMCKHLHLQDAIDWMAAIPVGKLQPLFELLVDAQKQCITYGADPGRLYVKAIFPEWKRGNREIVFHRATGNWGYGILQRDRNSIRVIVEQLNPGEYFHKLHILKKVPRSLSTDMKVALAERRVGPQAAREWRPYLTAFTRSVHHREMKVDDGMRRFDYFAERQAFVTKYLANVARREEELLDARRPSEALKAREEARVAEEEVKLRQQVTALTAKGKPVAQMTMRQRRMARRIEEEQREHVGGDLAHDLEQLVPGGKQVNEGKRAVQKAAGESYDFTKRKVGSIMSGVRQSWNDFRNK